jgi:hypothetical protein
MLFQFKIKIEGLSKPPVWRKVEVPAAMSFLQFHQVIQTVFGWENAHLWNFEPLTKSRRCAPSFRIEEPYEDMEYWDDAKPLIASDTALDRIFPSVKELVYTYDYGDNWTHSIKLEGIVDEERAYAVCTGGKGATPPEDCGGTGGYEALKEAFEEHDENEMETYRDWLDLDDNEVWDPDFFCAEDLKNINTKLKRIQIPTGAGIPSAASKAFVSEHAGHPDYYTIQELLKRKTVAELRSIAMRLAFKFKAGVKKDVMLDVIAERMTQKSELLIKAAFHYELKAFLDIINGDMSVEYAEQSGLLFDLNRFGLIYALDHHDSGESTLHLQMDMADILRPLIPAELERRERDGSLLFEKLALGCANIYGYTEMYYLQDYYGIVEERIGRKFDAESLTNAFYPIIAEMECGSKAEKHILLTPFSKFINFYPDEDHIRFEIAPKKFDFDTIVRYGEMPYPQFKGKEAAALCEVILKYGKEDCDEEDIMRRLWLNHQDGQSKSPLPNLDFLEIPDMSALQPCLDAIMDFQNNVPCWKLSGNSSQEVAKYEMAAMNGKKPRITMGPKMRAMGIESWEQLEDMARRGEEIPARPFATSKKVGRNDPCPCGSGKKYKHCCGRNK